MRFLCLIGFVLEMQVCFVKPVVLLQQINSFGAHITAFETDLCTCSDQIVK